MQAWNAFGPALPWGTRRLVIRICVVCFTAGEPDTYRTAERAQKATRLWTSCARGGMAFTLQLLLSVVSCVARFLTNSLPGASARVLVGWVGLVPRVCRANHYLWPAELLITVMQWVGVPIAPPQQPIEALSTRTAPTEPSDCDSVTSL